MLATLALDSRFVTIDAMAPKPPSPRLSASVAANYILSAKDNQSKLANSIRDFFATFKANPAMTPHDFAETVKKDHGWIPQAVCPAQRCTTTMIRPWLLP